MRRTLFVTVQVFAVAALAACGQSKKEAVANLQATAENTSQTLVEVAGHDPDATQANTLINESLELDNASGAVSNASVKHSKAH